jgi:hypothetical protein
MLDLVDVGLVSQSIERSSDAPERGADEMWRKS